MDIHKDVIYVCLLLNIRWQCLLFQITFSEVQIKKCKVESASNMSSNMTFDDEENTCNDEFYSNDVENEEEEEVSEK